MKLNKLFLMFLSFALVVSLASCDLFGGGDNPGENTDTPAEPGISITAEKTELTAGEETALTVTVVGLPSLTYTLKSSDSSVISFVGSTVKAAENITETKTVTVTATADADKSVTATVTLTVSPAAYVPKGNISMTLDADSIIFGETVTVRVNVTGLESAGYSVTVSDSALATYASGKLSLKSYPEEDTELVIRAVANADSALAIEKKITALAPKITASLSRDRITIDDVTTLSLGIIGTSETAYTVTTDRPDLLEIGEGSLKNISAVSQNLAATVTVALTNLPNVKTELTLYIDKPAPSIRFSATSTVLRYGVTEQIAVNLYYAGDMGYTVTTDRPDLLTVDADGNLNVIGQVTEDTAVKVTAKGDAYPFPSHTVTFTVRKNSELPDAERTERINNLINAIGSFVPGSNWEITKMVSAYGEPVAYPEENAHPRLLVNADTLPTVRANLTAEENRAAYLALYDLSNRSIDHIVEGERCVFATDYTDMNIIEAKAFRYLLEGDELYGYEAILAIKNYLLKVEVPETGDDLVRRWGYVMNIAACVYDWCYDLLTASDKQQIIAGVEGVLGPHFEMGFPPAGQGGLIGHGQEAQLLKDWLSFAIATADEAPDIYEFVVGRITSEYVPAQNFILSGGLNAQGTGYGPLRNYFQYCAQFYMKIATGVDLFSDDLEFLPISFIQFTRPDGYALRLGDSGEYVDYLNYSYLDYCCYFGGTYYGNTVLKGLAKSKLGNFEDLDYFYGNGSHCCLTAPMFLALNDPAIGTSSLDDLSPVSYNPYPYGVLTARTSRFGEDAVMVYMKVGEAYNAGHEDRDAGSFQIYYKGLLAVDSGYYDKYGSEHDWAYASQTVAHNSILVYNPNITEVVLSGVTWVYAGGQSTRDISHISEAATLDLWKARQDFNRGTVIGVDYECSETSYSFAYLAGDITNAYDSETVDEVSRYMFSAITDDKDCPMVFFVFDRITADDASYKKTFLLHTLTEPSVSPDGIVTVDNGEGKLVLQSLVCETDVTLIGGEGREYEIGGVNYAPTSNAANEVDWGRVEISPSVSRKTDTMLTVMYVTDSAVNRATVYAETVDTEEAAGAVIFNQAVIFPKENASFYDEFSVYTGESESLEYTVCGLPVGTWTVNVNGVDSVYTVEKATDTLRFTAAGGDVTFTPGTDIRPEDATATIFYNLGGGTLPADAQRYHFAGTAVTTLPTPTKANAFFVGWYSNPAFTGAAIKEIKKNDYSSRIDLYANWASYLINDDFSNGSTVMKTNAATKEFMTYSIVEDAEDPSKNYLNWSCTKSGVQFYYDSTNIAASVDKDLCISYQITIRTDDDASTNDCKRTSLYVHDKAGEYFRILNSQANGIYYLGPREGASYASYSLGDLSKGPITFRIVLDFKNGTMRAYDGEHRVIDEVDIPFTATAKSDGIDSAEDFLAYLNREVFVWSTSGTGTILCDEVLVISGDVFD